MGKPLGRPPTPMEQRFWSKVDRTGDCWIWTAGKNKGYGQFNLAFGKQVILAHRASWQIHFGPIPPGMCVCHHCDNPPCIRPSHLWLGTYAQNNADRVAKGRNSIQTGESNNAAKLTATEVRAIRSDGRTEAAIAAACGVSQSTIHLIKARKTWSLIE